MIWLLRAASDGDAPEKISVGVQVSMIGSLWVRALDPRIPAMAARLAITPYIHDHRLRQYKEYQRLLREARAPPGCSQCGSLRTQCADLQARCVQLERQLVTTQAAVKNGGTDAESRQESPSTRKHERPGRIRRKAVRAAARAAAAEIIAAEEANAVVDDTSRVLAVSDRNRSFMAESGSSAPTTSLVDPVASPTAAAAGLSTSEGDEPELISAGVQVRLLVVLVARVIGA
ncbi:hypothetical protein BZA05DRAFT_447791 [Tricharina praecox]|uniref:uncharacterized protein n=1 Tax=Tricharina praecox TaxID=43433 RepID=UPI00221F8E13|nr:uncharacterized protein BZA05DRAFT_447791 [Tricharina praecox]KAI5845469.1 hypothetical protein BZA05DRAFT_447791 [Tricharina praecox]